MEKQIRNVAALMIQATEAMQPMAQQQGVVLAVKPSDVEILVDCDYIVQALTNLLSNAIKFSSPDNTVWLTAELQEQAVLFSVRDEGQGIPLDKLETIFDPSRMAQHHNFKTGVCTTGNSLDKTEACDERMLANDATVKDMEAASIAWTAKLHETPFLGVKVVTDIVDGDVPTHEEFMANLATASTKMQEALPLVLAYVSGKEHHEF